jgi:hypothetical protein
VKTEDDDRIMALMERGDALKEYEGTLGPDLNNFAEAVSDSTSNLYARVTQLEEHCALLHETLDGVVGRLKVIEGGWNPSKAQPKHRNGGEPSETARTSPAEAYVVARAILPERFWNQATSFYAFARTLFASYNAGRYPKDKEELLPFLQERKDSLSRSGSGLMHAWEWGEANGRDLCRRAGVDPKPDISAWFGVAFWQAKVNGVPTDVIVKTIKEDAEFLKAFRFKLQSVQRNTNAGRHFIIVSFVDWFLNHGLARRAKQ